MLSQWSIRKKLKLGLGLLLLTVLTLFGSAYYGLYAYRGLLKSLRARSAELPMASRVRQHVGDLRVLLSQAHDRSLESPVTGVGDGIHSMVEPTVCPFDQQLLREQYRTQLELLTESIATYRRQLDQNRADADPRLGDDTLERETLGKIDRVLSRIGGDQLDRPFEADWLLDRVRISQLRQEIETLRELVAVLPSHLHDRLHLLSGEVRAHYRTAIITAWVTAMMAAGLLVMIPRSLYQWIAKPLEQLVRASRQVAEGKFGHRILLETQDEMGELADAMNAMTQRFQETKEDLDRQVEQRTSEVLRSEQLASVGFLAAGVAHEINNPLASIALCSESLEGRMAEMLHLEKRPSEEDIEVAHHYMQMIQQESFRCKQITEKLLDFARMGDSERHSTDLRELTSDVIEMVQHLGKYQDKRLLLDSGKPVIVQVNAQEMKQVVLNLITNGLESVDRGGTVRISIVQEGPGPAGGLAKIIVEDNGCGMTDETRKHLFEPFYTRRRTGQGTGLGLSITYRIIEEHHGKIIVSSGGIGKGARFVVLLPVHPRGQHESGPEKQALDSKLKDYKDMKKEESHRHQAA